MNSNCPVIQKEPLSDTNTNLEKSESYIEDEFVDLSLLPDGEIFRGLECLENVNAVDIAPDKAWYIEYRPFGFSVSDNQGKKLLEAKPCDSNCLRSARSLALLDLTANPILELTTNAIYCCGLFKTREAQISIPCKRKVGSVTRQQVKNTNIFNRGYEIKYIINSDEHLTFTVEVVSLPPEIRILMQDQVVAKLSVESQGCSGFSKVVFIKEDLSPNIKAIFILFAMSRHIFILENVNTCSCTCYLCVTSSLGLAGCLGII